MALIHGTDVNPPTIVSREVKDLILCGPGPCNLWPSVSEALNKPVLWPNGDDYHELIGEIKQGIQYIFQTKTHLLLAVSGSGHAGMETVITNLVGPGETLLVAKRGIWDERALNIASRYGIKTVAHSIPMDSTFSISELETVIKKIRPTALFITHGDSSTGTVQNLLDLGDICHRYNCLLIVDTVVSLVGEPFFMDKWGVDAVYTSTQKALSGPAGISPVAFSALAEKKINSRKHSPPFYFDMKLLADQWDCYGNTRAYHHTLSPPLMWALHAALIESTNETLPVSWARHDAAKKRFFTKLEKLPMKFFIPKFDDRLNTVTTLILPPGYDNLQVRNYIREKHGIVIYGGLGPTAGKVLRVGIMGVNATPKVVDAIIEALDDALKVLGPKSKL